MLKTACNHSGFGQSTPHILISRLDLSALQHTYCLEQPSVSFSPQFPYSTFPVSVSRMQSLAISSLDPTSSSTIFAQILAAASTILLLFLISVLPQFANKIPQQQRQHQSPKPVSPINIPLIIPGRISHARLFPKHHSFSYSYLMVGIPIHSPNRGNWVLSIDQRAWWKRGWLRVEAADHLGRGCDKDGIHSKLRSYLESQVGKKCSNPSGNATGTAATNVRSLNFCSWYLQLVGR